MNFRRFVQGASGLCLKCNRVVPIHVHGYAKRKYWTLDGSFEIAVPRLRYSCCGATFRGKLIHRKQGIAFRRGTQAKSPLSDGVRAYALVLHVLGYPIKSILASLDEKHQLGISRTTFWRWFKAENDPRMLELHSLNAKRNNQIFVATVGGSGSQLTEALKTRPVQWIGGGHILIRLRADSIGELTLAWIVQYVERNNELLGARAVLMKRKPRLVRGLTSEEKERPDLAFPLVLLERVAYGLEGFSAESWLRLFREAGIRAEVLL